MSNLAYAYEAARKIGEYGHGYKNDYPEFNYVAALFIMWLGFFIVIIYLLHVYWDEIEAMWNAVANRKAIRNVTIRIKGTEVDQGKIRSLTKDVNALLDGKLVNIVEEKHRINARHIVGMSVTPGKDCLFFTMWYKR